MGGFSCDAPNDRLGRSGHERLILPLAPDDQTVNMSLTGAEGFGFG